MAPNDNMIAALRRERAVYETQGKTDRVRQVDEQLEHYGYTGDPDENDGPQGRTEGAKATADAGTPAAKKTAAKKSAASKPPAVTETERSTAPSAE